MCGALRRLPFLPQRTQPHFLFAWEAVKAIWVFKMFVIFSVTRRRVQFAEIIYFIFFPCFFSWD